MDNEKLLKAIKIQNEINKKFRSVLKDGLPLIAPQQKDELNNLISELDNQLENL